MEWMLAKVERVARERDLMIKTLRPWQFFSKLKGNRDVLYRIPSHAGVESETIMSLETMLLVSAARLVEAKTILEFGTSLGYNAFQLARNTEARIVTIDNQKEPHIFDGEPESVRIDAVQKDLFLISPERFDLVFCDINYTLETMSFATKTAFACEPKVIAWHDYGHPLNPHVKGFLDRVAEEKDLIHVEDSWMVFWFKEDFS